MARHDTAVQDSLEAAKSLNLFGIDLPTDASRWLDKLNELRADRPEDQAHDHVAHLIADSAKASVIDAALAYRATQHLRISAHAQAQAIVGQRTLVAVLADRDRIHLELKITADQLISRLHQAALITSTIVELTRARRTDEAHLLATAESDCHELIAMYQIRDQYLTPERATWSTGWWSASMWQNPWDVEAGQLGAHDGTTWGSWSAAIKVGGRLWYPSHEEAVEASKPHEPGDVLPPFDPVKSIFVG